MFPEVILYTALAVFAVFGLYTAVRLIVAAIFRAEGCCVAVEFRTQQDAARAAYLVACARERLFLSGAPIKALIAPELAGNAPLLAFLKEEEIPYHIVRFADGKGG